MCVSMLLGTHLAHAVLFADATAERADPGCECTTKKHRSELYDPTFLLNIGKKSQSSAARRPTGKLSGRDVLVRVPAAADSFGTAPAIAQHTQETCGHIPDQPHSQGCAA